MARHKQFDTDKCLDAAIVVFRDVGFEGASAGMLVKAMGIGRQSLYDTFGDKWRLYLAAVRRYVTMEVKAHVAALRGPVGAIDGFRDMMNRVVATAADPCLGVHSIGEFGTSRADLAEIHHAADTVLRRIVVERAQEAIAAGDMDRLLAPDDVATFLTSSFAGIRIAARGGATPGQLTMLGDRALLALR